MRTLMKIVLTIPLLLLPFMFGLPPARAATFTVTNTNDSGAGSLRDAINNASSYDNITFSIATGSSIILSSPLEIYSSVTVDGGNSNITISGNNSVQVFKTESGGSLTLQNLTVANGKSSYVGGGIYNERSMLTVTNCAFINNFATNDGGGIYSNGGTLTATNCTFSDNSAANGFGGGINNRGTGLTATNCTFSNNSATNGGGGIYNLDTLTVTNCTFINNSATNGGGIDLGGGTVTNCTFSGNSASNYGGGIDNAGISTLIVTNCTFNNNSANFNSGGIFCSNLTVTNCIVWNSSLGSNSATVSYSDIGDPGYAGSNNNKSVDPLLGALGTYGGPVQTIPLLPGSPAIDTGTTDAGIPTIDARGIGRSAPDMGAFESQGFTIAIDSDSNQTAPVGSSFADSLKVSVTSNYSEPVDGGKVTFIAPVSGASASFDVNPATIASGAASINATANSEIGPYDVTAGAPGASPATFSLTNNPASDLAVTMSHTGAFTPGGNITYNITVTNNGPSPASDVTVTEPLSPILTFISCTPTIGTASFNAGTLTGTIGTLASGSRAILTFMVNIPPGTRSGTSISNTATVSSLTADPNLVNNLTTDPGIVTVPVPVGFTITPATLAFTEGDAVGAFTVCLNSAPVSDVTIPVSSADTSQITVSPSSLTFTNTDWSAPQTVTVTPVDDALYDGNQLVKAVLGSATSTDPQYSGLDPADVSVTVQDNDFQSNSGGGSSPSPVSSTTGSANVIPYLGGKISLGSNITLDIPAYALLGSNSLWVEIKKADPAPALPSGFMIMGSAYRITVDDQEHYKFNKPVTITFTFDPAQVPDGEVPAIYYYDSSASQWVSLDGTVSNNTISVMADHFTVFGVLVREKGQIKMNTSFTDIENNWAREAIKKLAGMGAVSGYQDGTFRPESKITRGEFVTILVKALNLKSTASAPVFSDTADHFAKDSIATAAALGIVGGYEDSTFRPDDLITREQMAVIAIKALKLAGTSGETTFSDNGRISAWAKASVLTTINSSIMKGYPDNTFKPQGNTTRAEAVSVIFSLINE